MWKVVIQTAIGRSQHDGQHQSKGYTTSVVRTYLNRRNRLFYVLGFLLLLFGVYRVFSTAWRSVEEKAVVQERWNDRISTIQDITLWCQCMQLFYQTVSIGKISLPVTSRGLCGRKMTYQRVG